MNTIRYIKHIFHPREQPKIKETKWIHKEKRGIYKHYYESGIVQFEGYFKNKKLNGPGKYYTEVGTHT